MAIVGFGFTKLEVERKKPLGGKINIRNNIAIKDVEEHNFSAQSPQMLKERKGLRFLFEFVSNYEPDAAVIRLKGEVIFMADKKKVDEVLKSWKKDKKLPQDVLPVVLNYALNRAHVEAIALSRDVALPPPIQMPRIKVDAGEKNYIG